MTPRAARSLTILATVGLGACAAPVDDAGAAREPVIGGVEIATHGESVALVGESLCSGVLVAPRIVATAAHCVDWRPDAVVLGASIDDPSEVAVVTGGAVHPDWQPGSFDADVGLLLLDAAPAAAAPVEIAEVPIALGDSVRVVGWGMASLEVGAERSGTKREAVGTVSSVEPPHVVIAPTAGSPCGGDSGAPAYVMREDGSEALAGLVVAGDTACADHTRVLVLGDFRDWIAEASARLESGGPASEETETPYVGSEPTGLVGGCDNRPRSAHGAAPIALVAFGGALGSRRRAVRRFWRGEPAAGGSR